MVTISPAVTQPCGIQYEHSDGQRPVYLPLEWLQVHTQIMDVSASVTLTQAYWQGSPVAIPRAKYILPVPARAAVCAFEMRTEDGRVVTAVAKEKDTARKEHARAIREGRMTGLVEHVTDDIFSVSLGCLPQLQMITAKLIYVIDLTNDDFVDQVRFQLPVCIGMRYGTLPADMVDAQRVPSERVQISADVYMRGFIRSITSPTHPTTSTLTPTSLLSGSEPQRTVAQFNSQTFLDQDFVLIIRSDGLDTSRCFAERSPAGTVAMQLTLVPQLHLPVIQKQEYIFIVDRSGSMSGSRMETAKRALVMLLRALPRLGTVFNIVSFGSHSTSLWKESRVYDASSLEEATAHVDRIDSDYGGTEIGQALQHAFASRCVNMPTSCFLLTDGEAYDTRSIITIVEKASSGANRQAPLRVFTLGIGDTTSTAMCEGIARVGGGVCMMATLTESIVGKTSKLLKASRADILQDIRVDWGIPPALQSVSTEQEADVQHSPLRQGPQLLPHIYNGFRFNVFSIINYHSFIIPHEVTIHAQCASTGETLEFSIPVQDLSASQNPCRTFIHTLAARRIITDIEDASSRGTPSSRTKDTIIHLGEQYQLATRFTSFIVVDTEDESSQSDAASAPESISDDDLDLDSSASRRPSALPAMSRFLAAEDARTDESDVSSDSDDAPRVSRFLDVIYVDDDSEDEYSWEAVASQPLAQHEVSDEDMGFGLFDDAGYSTGPSISGPPPAQAPPAFQDANSGEIGHEEAVVQLVRLQSFDGSFSPSARLEQILGRGALEKGMEMQVGDVVWATVLAVVYLQKYLAEEPELLESLVEKAMEFLQGDLDASISGDMWDRAKALIQ